MVVEDGHLAWCRGCAYVVNLLESPRVLEYHGHADCATAVAFFADKHARNIGFFEVCVTRVTKSFFKTIDY